MLILGKQELVSGIHAESKSQQTLERLIASAELLMKALRLSKNKDDRLRLNRKCQSMLDRAEKIKSALNNGTSSAGNKSGAGIAPQGKKLTTTPRSIQVLSTKEKVILLESSRVNGFIFPPWDSKPEAVEFDLKEGERKYTYAANSHHFMLYRQSISTKLFLILKETMQC